MIARAMNVSSSASLFILKMNLGQFNNLQLKIRKNQVNKNEQGKYVVTKKSFFERHPQKTLMQLVSN